MIKEAKYKIYDKKIKIKQKLFGIYNQFALVYINLILI